jgi:hypothetical protein
MIALSKSIRWDLVVETGADLSLFDLYTRNG